MGDPVTALGYRPALDGLRCVAVLFVLAFHARTRLTGGWIGVDIFFVLSGFLITTLLLQEWERFGSVAMRAFYGRRARRLLPALGLTIVLVGLIYALDSRISRPAGVQWGVLAAALYVANLAHVNLGLLEHTWSLSLEEQFYILWPPVVVFCLRRAWRLERLLALAVGLAALVATARGILWVTSRDYYALNWRCDGLLIGCALSIAVRTPWGRGAIERVSVSLAAAFAAVTALLVYSLSVTPTESLNFLGGLSIVPAAAGILILHVVTAGRSPVARLLSQRPLVWTGRRSYGIYLYHFPIFAVAASFGRSHWPTIAAETAATFLVAALSYRWVELYFLRGKRYHGGATPARARLLRQGSDWRSAIAPASEPAAAQDA